jgi:hypothetical protein
MLGLILLLREFGRMVGDLGRLFELFWGPLGFIGDDLIVSVKTIRYLNRSRVVICSGIVLVSFTVTLGVVLLPF